MRQKTMKRIMHRLAIAVVSFSLGVSVSAIYRLYSAPEVTLQDLSTPPGLYFPPGSSCFPGLSVAVEKSAYFAQTPLAGHPWHSQFRSDWYSRHLRAMNEVALPFLVNDDESYRFLWLRTFHHPVAIHLWRSGSER